jgi:hypothetical protein
MPRAHLVAPRCQIRSMLPIKEGRLQIATAVWRPLPNQTSFLRAECRKKRKKRNARTLSSAGNELGMISLSNPQESPFGCLMHTQSFGTFAGGKTGQDRHQISAFR